MKELSIEEKARRYDEAIERAKGMYEEGMMSERIEYIFPELKEDEDERIRGAISDYLKDHNLIEWASWLEKHGDKDKFIEKELEYIKGYREKAIEDAIEFLGCTEKVREDLKSLHEQLKKLREEL